MAHPFNWAELSDALGCGQIRVPADSAQEVMTGLRNTGCWIESWAEDRHAIGSRTVTITYKMPWKIRADEARAETEIAEQNRQANEEMLAQHEQIVRTFSMPPPAVGGYPMANAPGGTAWIVPAGPAGMGSVSVSRYSGDLAAVLAKPQKPQFVTEPDYWTLRRDFIANGGGIRALDKMLAKVTLAEPDLDKVRAEPDPPSPYTDGLHDPHYMEKLTARQQPARALRKAMHPVMLAVAIWMLLTVVFAIILIV